MAKIEQFTSPFDTFTPSEAGAETLARTGRYIRADYDMAGRSIASGIETAGQAVGKVVKEHLEHQDISGTSASGAELLDNKVNEWNSLTKDADPHNMMPLAQKFREGLEPALQKLQDAPVTEKGRNHALALADSIRQHLFQTTTADVNNAAADATGADVTKTVDHLANLAATDPTPHTLDMALSQVDAAIKDQVDAAPFLTAGVRAKLKTTLLQQAKSKIADAGIMGMIQKNPDAALGVVNSGKYSDYISGAQAVQAINTAKRVQRMEASQARVEATLQAKEKSEGVQRKLLDTMVVRDPQGLPTGEIRIDPKLPATILALTANEKSGLKPEEARTMLNFVEGEAARLARPPVISDPRVHDDFANRAFSAGSDALTEQEIMEARNHNKLSAEDIASLLHSVQINSTDPAARPEYAELMKQAAAFKPMISIGGGMNMQTGAPMKDAPGEFQYSEMLRDVRRTFDRQRRGGIPAKELLSPESPVYVFRGIEKYILSDQQKAAWTSKVLGGKLGGDISSGAAPQVHEAPEKMRAKPGENVEEWLKRTQF